MKRTFSKGRVREGDREQNIYIVDEKIEFIRANDVDLLFVGLSDSLIILKLDPKSRFPHEVGRKSIPELRALACFQSQVIAISTDKLYESAYLFTQSKSMKDTPSRTKLRSTSRTQQRNSLSAL